MIRRSFLGLTSLLPFLPAAARPDTVESRPPAGAAEMRLSQTDLWQRQPFQQSATAGAPAAPLGGTRVETALRLKEAGVDPAAVSARTDGFARPGDGGGGLYRAVPDEPGHPGKLRSADGRWWELAPEGGAWAAEQFGAVGRGEVDDHAALTAALQASARTGVTLRAKGLYLLSDTLRFPSGRYGFEGPDVRSPGKRFGHGFDWAGGDGKPIIEILSWTESRVTSLVVSNARRRAKGVTGILMHNPDDSGASITNCVFDFMGVYGCDVGLKIGDYERDGYDSNWEQNEIGNVHFWDVANPLVIDSDHQDNILIGRFHNGGPAKPGPTLGERRHVIEVRRNGQGLTIQDGFARVDGIVPGNAAVSIDDGSFSCGFLSFEGSEPCRLLDLNATALSRDQSVIHKIIGLDNQRDDEGRTMILASRSATTLIGCCVGGDILCRGAVTAVGCVFRSGAGFRTEGPGDITHIGTRERPAQGRAVSPGQTSALGEGVLERRAAFHIGPLARGREQTAPRRIEPATCHVWRVLAMRDDAIDSVLRVYVLRARSGRISTSGAIAESGALGGSAVAIHDAGRDAYGLVIGNTGDVETSYAGWLESVEAYG